MRSKYISYLKHPVVVHAIPWITGIWTAITIYLTTFPTEKLVELDVFKYDKLGHFLIFGGWTFLLGLIRLVYLERVNSRLYPIVLAGIFFGGLIEIAQLTMPYGRSASWFDMLANILGCLTAYGLLRIIQNSLRRTI